MLLELIKAFLRRLPGLLLSMLLVMQGVQAASELDKQQVYIAAIEQVLRDYIEGTSYNNREQIARAFHPDAELLLEKTGVAFQKLRLEDYLAWYKPENQGKFNGRIGEILAINFSGELAMAKLEIIVPKQQARYIDTLILKQVAGRWQIISKAALKQSSKQHGTKILFIVSSAHFHGSSTLPAGASFAEIVHAYDTFKEAGYTVDFVSPEGGAVPLAYINTSSQLEKNYLYDADFMFALRNTKRPEQVLASEYRAVHYIGGSSAMYGVADNQAIARLVMQIYETHHGIISSVCHGTAGIVFLKTKDGNYLVEGKRISGYPEDLERAGAEYFKHFPFLIKQTVQQHKGSFHFVKADEPYIEVDGRLVTGQNYKSSALVAREIIRQLDAERAKTE